MTQTSDIADRLHLTASRIAQWKLDAKRLSAILHERPGRLEPLVMLDVEETTGAIYREITAFDTLVADVDRRVTPPPARSPRSATRCASCCSRSPSSAPRCMRAKTPASSKPPSQFAPQSGSAPPPSPAAVSVRPAGTRARPACASPAPSSPSSGAAARHRRTHAVLVEPGADAPLIGHPARRQPRPQHPHAQLLMVGLFLASAAAAPSGPKL